MIDRTFVDLLKGGDFGKVEDFLQRQYDEFCQNWDDIKIKVGFVVPNFNDFMTLIGFEDDFTSPIQSEMFCSDETTTNNITVYKTKFEFMYLFRMEQFAIADEDAILTDIVFTLDIDKIIEEDKAYLSRTNIVRKARESYKQS